jgi:RHS repeat-associated protein
MSGVKGSDLYAYIDSILYNKYGSRSEIFYGNGTHAQYAYDTLNQRLIGLKSYDMNTDLMQDIEYTYDDASNILEIENFADAVNGDLGGKYHYRYTYDNIYRLTSSGGAFGSYYHGGLEYQLSMSYSASGNITNKTLDATTEILGNISNNPYNNDYLYEDRPHTITSAGVVNYRWDANGNMISSYNNSTDYTRLQCWDEENRLTTIRNIGEKPPSNLSSYIYNASGERTWKLTGVEQLMLINGQNWVNMVTFDKTLYASPYMVMTEQEYTKHYFIEGERICSKIGSGFELSPIQICDNPLEPITEQSVVEIAEALWAMVLAGIECTEYDPGNVFIEPELEPACNEKNEEEKDRYFYHSDHLGSSAFITDVNGEVLQHLQYLPFGETYIDQRHSSPYQTPYKFSGKEKDEESGYSYFGARYYDADLSVWLSVDPMAGKYPSLSPYLYVGNNPVIYIDPNGKYRLPKRLQKKYRTLTRLLKNMEALAKYDAKVWTAFKETVGLNEEQATDIVTWGKGPKIKVKDLEELGNCFSKNKINLDLDLVLALEGEDNNNYTAEEAKTLGFSTIIHEGVEAGANMLKKDEWKNYNEETDISPDWGDKFEIEAFGAYLEKYENMYQKLQKDKPDLYKKIIDVIENKHDQ